MKKYSENELKVLDINVPNTVALLESIGAKLVYDGIRHISTYDTINMELKKKDILLRLTNEGKVKLTVHVGNSRSDRDVIRIHPSNAEEICNDFLQSIGFIKQTNVESRRISYEFNGMDFDIDCFPKIPPFMEIDMSDSIYDIEQLKKILCIEDNIIVRCGTEAIFKRYGLDYYNIFKTN